MRQNSPLLLLLPLMILLLLLESTLLCARLTFHKYQALPPALMILVASGGDTKVMIGAIGIHARNAPCRLFQTRRREAGITTAAAAAATLDRRFTHLHAEICIPFVHVRYHHEFTPVLSYIAIRRRRRGWCRRYFHNDHDTKDRPLEGYDESKPTQQLLSSRQGTDFLNTGCCRCYFCCSSVMEHRRRRHFFFHMQQKSIKQSNNKRIRFIVRCINQVHYNIFFFREGLLCPIGLEPRRRCRLRSSSLILILTVFYALSFGFFKTTTETTKNESVGREESVAFKTHPFAPPMTGSTTYTPKNRSM